MTVQLAYSKLIALFNNTRALFEMTEELMKELIFSLAWYDSSNHHYCNVHKILTRAFPEADFSKSLEEFVKYKTPPTNESNPG